MATNSSDLDKQTYGKGYQFATSDLNEIQENSRGAIRRGRQLHTGYGVISVPPTITAQSPASLFIDVGPAEYLDPLGRGFRSDASFSQDLSSATAGSILGSTSPSTSGTLRYIVLAGRYQEINSEPATDEDGLPYNFRQEGAPEYLIYQTADISAPDVIENSVTLAALFSTIVSENSIPIAVGVRDFGSVTISTVWVVVRRVFEEGSGDPVKDKTQVRNIIAYSELPIIANSSGTVQGNPIAVPGSGGQIQIPGGESIQIGWIDHADSDELKRLEITLPAITLDVTAASSKHMIRMFVDRDRNAVVYTGLGEYLVDPDFGLLSTGTSGGSNQGSRPTLVDIPLLQITTGVNGSVPTVEQLQQSARLNEGIFLPYQRTETWANTNVQGSANSINPITLPSAINTIVADLAQSSTTEGDDTGADRIGASPHNLLFPANIGITGTTIQDQIKNLVSRVLSSPTGAEFNTDVAISPGATAYSNPGSKLYNILETWSGGKSVIQAANSSGALIDQPVQEFGDLSWTLTNLGATDLAAISAGKYLSSSGSQSTPNFDDPSGPFAGGFLRIDDTGTAQATAALRIGSDVGDITASGMKITDSVYLRAVFEEVGADTNVNNNDYTFGFGFTSLNTRLNTVLSDPSFQGFGFVTNPDTNANWFAFTRNSAGTVVIQDTTIPTYNATRHDFSLVKRVNATTMQFYIDGVQVADLAIPNDISNETRTYTPSYLARRFDSGAPDGEIVFGPFHMTIAV